MKQRLILSNKYFTLAGNIHKNKKMKQEKTKVDIIVEILGERDPEIQRLVALDDKVRTFAAKAEEGDDTSEMSIEIIAEWALLQDKFYAMAVKKKRAMTVPPGAKSTSLRGARPAAVRRACSASTSETEKARWP